MTMKRATTLRAARERRLRRQREQASRARASLGRAATGVNMHPGRRPQVPVVLRVELAADASDELREAATEAARAVAAIAQVDLLDAPSLPGGGALRLLLPWLPFDAPAPARRALERAALAFVAAYEAARPAVATNDDGGQA